MGANYRYSQFTDAENYVSQKGEVHIVPSSSPYIVKLNEVPDKESGITMRLMDLLMVAMTDAAATSITVANGSWHNAGDIITIDSEQMTVSATSGNTLTVTRGSNSTVATTHTAFTPVYIESSMTEVAASPSERQFWPDYSTGADSDSDWNTGTILFNDADAGKIISINYIKTGSVAAANADKNCPPWCYDRGDGSDGDFIPTADCTISGVKNYRNVVIAAGITVTVGSEPLILKVQNACYIAGKIDASGGDGSYSSGASSYVSGGTGKGGGASGSPYSVSSTTDGDNNTTYTFTGNPDVGTGGGAGGNGYGCSGLHNGGKSYINGLLVCAEASATPSSAYQKILQQTLMPLGGAGGAAGSMYNNNGISGNSGGAGAGGGGVALFAGDNITNYGTINVAGGVNSDANSKAYVASGGAGGGLVAIIAKEIFIASTGIIDVSGGDAGDIRTVSSSCTDGGAGWYKFINTEA
jgi:hypothetical protein